MIFRNRCYNGGKQHDFKPVYDEMPRRFHGVEVE
jgi:hypothetical protein